MRVHVAYSKPGMFELTRSFYQLLILQRAPQDFPASRFLLAIVLVAYLSMGVINNWLASEVLVYALLRSLLAVALVLAGSYLLLLGFRRQSRWMQTCIALLGGEALIGYIRLPFLFVVVNGINNIFLEISLLLFLVWLIAFIGHVWKHALDSNLLVGILIALGLVIWYSYIKIWMLPFPGGA